MESRGRWLSGGRWNRCGNSLDSSKLNQPIVGFVLDQKGLMYNLTLEGSKLTKINK